MQNKLFRKFLALLLVLVMTFQILPVSVFAEEDDESTDATIEVLENTDDSTEPEPTDAAEILEEIEELRTEEAKHFRMSDGTYMAVSYGMPVHYQGSDGEWEDIDNTMVLASDATTYSIAEDATTASFSNALTNGLLFSTGYNGLGISMSLLDESEVVLLAQGGDISISDDVSSEEDTEITNPTEGPVVPEEESEDIDDGLKAESAASEPVSEDESLSEETVEVASSDVPEAEEVLTGESSISESESTVEETGSGSEAEEIESEEFDISEELDAGLLYDRTVEAQLVEEEVSSSEPEEESSLEDQLMPEKLSSTILYEDVYPNVDLQYSITGYNIKESIIIKAPLEEYSFSFYITLNSMAPELTDDGAILLSDETGNVVYEIPAPYLFDSDNNVSSAAYYEIAEYDDGFVLTVIADDSWINAEDRVYPVTIDPTLLISAGTASGDISATYVEEGLPSTVHGHYQSLYLGYTTYESLYDRQIYMHFNTLPEVPKGSVVVDATLNLWQFDYSYVGETAMKVGAYPVTTAKPSTYSTYHDWIYYMTWNNKASYDTSNMIDFSTLSDSTDDGYVTWNLTELVNDWYYNGEENATVILKTIDTYDSSSYATAALYAYGSTKPPILTVTYRNNTGLESYYTYQTFGAGSAGTAYISDYSSQLTIVNELFSFNSSVLPFSFQQVFNSAYFAETSSSQYDLCSNLGMNMHIGSGITYNFIQQITKETISGITYLRYLDGDGTIHYFSKDSSKDSTYYYDEDGLGLKIEEYATEYYKLYDDQGNIMYFGNGLLLWIYDESGNRYELWYSQNGTISSTGYPKGSNDRLEYIQLKNKNGTTYKVATFSYGSHTLNGTSVSNYLTSITDYSGDVYSFTYTQGKLTAISRNGTQIASYTMKLSNSYYQNELIAMTDTESGYTLNFTYTNHKITAVQETSGSSVGKKIEIDPLDNRYTKYTDYGNNQTDSSDDIITCYAFDYAGRTINAYSTDSSGQIIGATNSAYTSTSSDTDKKKNKVSNTATIGIAATKKLENGGFESTGWTLSNFTWSTANPRTGAYSITSALSNSTATAKAYVSTDSLTKGTTYTVSAYVNTSAANPPEAGTGIYFALMNSSSSTTYFTSDMLLNHKTISGMDDGWVRISYQFTATVTGTHKLYICNYGITGSVYIDDIQLEVGKAPSSVNLLDNGDFQNSAYSDWTKTGTTTLSSVTGVDGTSTKAVKLTGYYGDYTKVSKTITVNLPATQTYVLSGWAKGNAVPDTTSIKDQWRSFGLRATITYSNDSTEVFFAPFNSALSDWQFSSVTIVPSKDLTVKTITVDCAFESNANVAYFDNISLTREAAQTMKYDDDGNLVSVTTLDLKEDTSTYENGNLIKTITAGYGTFDYTYDTTYEHRLTSVTNGVITENLTYDTYGNVNQTTLSGTSGNSIVTSATYTLTGNLLETVTDGAGNKTKYEYTSTTNKQLALPSSVTSAYGTSDAVTVNYEYDTYDRIHTSSIASAVNLVYTYEEGYLTGIARTDTAKSRTQNYNLTYDDFGNVTIIEVGSQVLASYGYDLNNGNLNLQTYGNGQTVKYSYDNLGRIEKAVYSTGRTLMYTYNGEGSLYSMTDSSSGRTYLYNYDSIGRLIGSSTSESGDPVLQTWHEYDNSNRLTSQTLDLGDKAYSESYTYDDYGRVSQMTAGDGTTITYTYDDLSRLSTVTTPVYEITYTYETGTTRLSNMSYKPVRANRLESLSFDVTYDALGNIQSRDYGTTFGTRSYEYDEQGQLTKQINASTTYTFDYDGFGNLTNVVNRSGTHTYTYGNSEWKDLLTAFDGETISYDNSGNPTSYYNGTRWSMTWIEGRRLTTATSEDHTISYTYDSDGLRLTKTVDGVLYEYVYAGGKLVQENIGDDIVMYFYYDQNGSPYAFSYNGLMLYYILSPQGDVIRLVSAAGSTYASYTYDAWGSPVWISDNVYAKNNPLRYRGYVYDSETGLYYVSSRYYDPEIGRFINADDVNYLGAGSNLTSYNLFAYCGNNPVMGYDPTGHWDWGWEEQAALGTTVLIVGLALLLAAPTGGSSLAFGALALSSSTAVAAGSAMAITGTVMIGDAIAASISEANGKPTSRNQMQKQVKSGKAPNEVDRVDPPHNDVDNSQNHIHFKDGTAINQDGSLSHKGNGIPNITRAILKWILDNGWSAPKF